MQRPWAGTCLAQSHHRSAASEAAVWRAGGGRAARSRGLGPARRWRGLVVVVEREGRAWGEGASRARNDPKRSSQR